MAKTKTEKIEAVDTKTLIWIAHDGRKRGYNRQLSEDFTNTLDWNGTHLVTFSLPHEHIGGKEVEPHMRVELFAKIINKREPTTVILDMSMASYDRFKILV